MFKTTAITHSCFSICLNNFKNNPNKVLYLNNSQFSMHHGMISSLSHKKNTIVLYLSVLCPCVLCFSPHVPSPWPNFSLMLIVPWFHLCFINYLVYSLVLKPCVSLSPASGVRHHSVSVSLWFCFIKVYVENLLCLLVPLLKGNCDSIFMLQTQVCLLWFISEPAGLVQGFKVFFFLEE